MDEADINAMNDAFLTLATDYISYAAGYHFGLFDLGAMMRANPEM